MIRKIGLWTVLVAFIGFGLFALGRAPNAESSPQSPPSFSLNSGSAGMISGGPGTTYNFSFGDAIAPEEFIAEIQRFLDRMENTDLTPARLREFTYAYQVEVIERSTGRHVFSLMLGKGTGQISPKAGPNIYWNTKYGSMIAQVGGGYGMLGRMLSGEPTSEMSVSERMAKATAEKAIEALNTGLKLADGVKVFYGFYEFNLSRDGELVGELDVNGYTGQLWYEDWGETQISEQDLTSG